MIVERGTVVSVGVGHAYVRTAGVGNCARCASGTGCGGMLMGRILGDRLHTVRADTNGFAALTSGDEVEVGLAESALLGGAMIAYLLPLLCLFAGMAIGFGLTAGSEAGAIAGAFVALAGGFVLARIAARRATTRRGFHPVIVSRVQQRPAGAMAVAGLHG